MKVQTIGGEILDIDVGNVVGFHRFVWHKPGHHGDYGALIVYHGDAFETKVIYTAHEVIALGNMITKARIAL